MNDVFADMLDICVVVYLNDILIYSSDKATHHKGTSARTRLWNSFVGSMYGLV